VVNINVVNIIAVNINVVKWDAPAFLIKSLEMKNKRKQQYLFKYGV